MAENKDVFQGLHQGQPVQMRAEAPGRARAAMLMLHGRGARAEDILSLADQLAQPGFVYFAPQAAGNTWYPKRFLEPLQDNEPWLSSALELVSDTFTGILNFGFPPERIMILGFSQGACLTLEFAARNARHFGGVAGLTGALIGPDDLPRNYPGSLAGTPVFLGCSDVDFHIAKERVEATAEILRNLGGSVTRRLYPDMGHTVNQDELEFVRSMMKSVIANF